MVSCSLAGPISGHQPETDYHFLVHSIGVPHLQQELEVIVVDPFVFNHIDILKIKHTHAFKLLLKYYRLSFLTGISLKLS